MIISTVISAAATDAVVADAFVGILIWQDLAAVGLVPPWTSFSYFLLHLFCAFTESDADSTTAISYFHSVSAPYSYSYSHSSFSLSNL